jgi:hypothetical protein
VCFLLVCVCLCFTLFPCACASLTNLLHAGIQRLVVTGDNPRQGEVSNDAQMRYACECFDSIYYGEDPELGGLKSARMHVSMIHLLCNHDVPVTSLTLWHSSASMKQTLDAVDSLYRVGGLKHLTLELPLTIEPRDRDFVFRGFIDQMWSWYPLLMDIKSVTVRNCGHIDTHTRQGIDTMPYAWTIMNPDNQVIFTQ